MVTRPNQYCKSGLSQNALYWNEESESQDSTAATQSRWVAGVHDQRLGFFDLRTVCNMLHARASVGVTSMQLAERTGQPQRRATITVKIPISVTCTIRNLAEETE